MFLENLTNGLIIQHFIVHVLTDEIISKGGDRINKC